MSELLERLQSAVGDGYRIERELGGGGMSRVFLAEETALSRQVVIKVLPPEMAAGVNKERFRLETQLAASLQHPLIVPILTAGAGAAHGDGSDLLYYIMPYIEGQSLRERLDRETELPIAEAARIIRDVADALGAAHERNVVHRDIKPDNVMLSGKHAMVTDFGVAKAVSASQATEQGGLTQFGMALGTPMYMAPEQAAGDPQTDHRADIYALGVMAYEALAGRLPFDADSPQAMLAAHVSQPPEPVTKHRATIPSALADLVMRCLEKKPADRWQNATELSAALDAWSGSGASTPLETSAVNLEAFVTANPPWRVVGAFAVAGLAFVGVVYLVMIQLGLPDWTFHGAVALAGLAVILGGVTAVTPPAGRPRMWRRTRAALTGGLGVLAVVVAGYSAMRVLGIGPVGTLVATGLLDEQDVLVLAEFDNLTSDSTLAGTVTELLRIDLAQSSTVSLFEQTQITSALRRMERDPTVRVSADIAMEIAQREGAKAVLGGEIRSLGGEYIIAATLVAATTGETLAAERETARDGELVGAVDRLSAALRERIGESLRTIRADAPLDQVTTRSTEALRLYAQADRANNEGDWRKSIRLLEDAIGHDSTFAMAHRKLAVVMTNQNQSQDRAQAAFTRAYELRDRLTARERLLAEASYHFYVADDIEQSIDAYETVLERYPTDRIALNNLAVSYRARGRFAEADTLYRRAIALRGAPAVTFTNAVQTQFDLGHLEVAETTLERFVEAYPRNPQVYRFRAALSSAQFDYDETEARIAEWQAAFPGVPAARAGTSLELSSLHAARGRMNEARRTIMEGYDFQADAGLGFITMPRNTFDGLVEGVITILVKGETSVAVLDRALQAADAASTPASSRDLLQFAGLYARAGRPERARELIRQYEDEVEQPATPSARSGALTAAYGNLAFTEGRPDEAIAAYHEARDKQRSCPLCLLQELGEAFLAVGAPDSAIVYLDRYVTAPSLFRLNSDSFTLWGVLIGLGEAHEAVGNREDAIEAYTRFVSLWENADPDLQVFVDNIQSRIARLVEQRR